MDGARRKRPRQAGRLTGAASKWNHLAVAQEKILVVEDDKDIVRLLKYNLEKEGYRVVAAADGEAGLAALRKERPELLILDVMVPKIDGFELLKLVRRESRAPVLMLTARKEEVDRVLGLELGADDYVIKPFGVRELLARVKALLRRAGPAEAAASLLHSPGGRQRALPQPLRGPRARQGRPPHVEGVRIPEDTSPGRRPRAVPRSDPRESLGL
jgi:CheY-like chemotaxis protein